MFQAYVSFGSIAAGATINQDFNIDVATFQTIRGFVANVSGGYVRVQLGLWNGSTWTPYGTKQTMTRETLEASWPYFQHDGSQQVRLTVTNIDSVSHDYFADCYSL